MAFSAANPAIDRSFDVRRSDALYCSCVVEIDCIGELQCQRKMAPLNAVEARQWQSHLSVPRSTAMPSVILDTAAEEEEEGAAL